MEKAANATSQALEVFLNEYCELKGIEEKDLKQYLVLFQDKRGTIVKEGDNEVFRETHNRSHTEELFSIDIYLRDKMLYPKTFLFLHKLKKDLRMID